MTRALAQTRAEWEGAMAAQVPTPDVTALQGWVAMQGSRALSLKPSYAGISRWDFCGDDTADIAVKVASLRGELGVSKAVTSALDKDWSKRHELVVDEQCPKIRPEHTRKTTIVCFDAGVCLCSAEGKQARLMLDQFNRLLKHVFPPASQPREDLTLSYFAVLLYGERPEDVPSDNGVRPLGVPHDAPCNSQSHFFHIADQSLSPFVTTFQHMTLLDLDDSKASCRAKPTWVSSISALERLPKDWVWRARFFRLQDTLEAIADFLPERQVYLEMPTETALATFWRGQCDQRKSRNKVWRDAPLVGQGDMGDGPSDRQNDGGGLAQDEEPMPVDDAEQSASEAADTDGDMSGSGSDLFGSSGDDDALGEAAAAAAPVGGALSASSGPSGSSTDPPAAPGAQPAAPAMGDRGILYYSVPGGEIIFYPQSNRFAAHCEHEQHGVCRRMKTASAGIPGSAQGRPLGYLMAWLADNAYDTHDDHLACTHFIGLPERIQGRELLKTVPGCEALFAKERPLWPDEEEEPSECP